MSNEGINPYKLPGATTMIAAMCTFEGQKKLHEAACLHRIPKHVKEARDLTHAALDAVLDAQEIIIQELMQQGREG